MWFEVACSILYQVRLHGEVLSSVVRTQKLSGELLNEMLATVMYWKRRSYAVDVVIRDCDVSLLTYCISVRIMVITCILFRLYILDCIFATTTSSD